MADSFQRKSWRLDADERTAWSLAIKAEVATRVPFGRLVVLGFEYFYDRRDLLFGPDAEPARALNMAGETLRLRNRDYVYASGLLAGRSGRDKQLVVVPRLTESARRAGIRSGDPVSLMLANQSFASARSGVLVPARLDRPVKLILPDDGYTATALAMRRASLFAPGDPVSGLGAKTAAARSPELILPVTARSRTSGTAPRTSSPPSGREVRCLWCGRVPPADAGFLTHFMSCPKRPQDLSCRRCGRWFVTEGGLQAHRTLCEGEVCPTCLARVTGDEGHKAWCWRPVPGKVRQWWADL